MKMSYTSIKTKLQRTLVLLVILTASIVAMVAIISMLDSYKKVNIEMKNAIMENNKSNLRYHVRSVASLINQYTKHIKDGHVPDELKNTIINSINSINYNHGTDYMFINTTDGTVIADQSLLSHPYLKAHFSAISQQLSKIALHGGGFFVYDWLKPGGFNNKLYRKLSYVQLLKHVPWYIGAGIYIDDLDRFIDRQVKKQSDSLRLLIVQFMALTFALIIITLFISTYFSNRFSQPIIQVAHLAKRISEGDYHVEVNEKYNDELGIMAQSFNVMAKNIANKIRKLTSEEQYIRHLFESVADGIIVTDTHHKIKQVNSAATRLFETSEKELLTTHLNLLLPIKTITDQKNSVLDEVLAGKTIANFNVMHKKMDGSECYLSVAVSPVHEEDGSIKLIIYSIKDETDQHLLESKLDKMNNLKKYFTPHVVEEIMSGKSDVTMDYSRKKLTIFFSDLVGFSDLSDNLEAEELTSILSEYLTCMSNIVYKYSGTLDKFIGDAVMAFFGAPTSKGVAADAACCINMALEMRSQLDKLNEKWKLDSPLSMRIGINTGFVTVGNFGSDFRLEYTVIGAPVNIAARLEQNCPADSILISHDTAQYVHDLFQLKEGEAIHLKGFHHLVKTYEVLGKVETSQ